ncbi:OmpA family protein [Burkholderia ubonensis]|uniref:OmpA family protein n=1 Tax=Burkholderia ubonensis TaxID=101571 RepID=UPI000ABD0E31|nr:OmpA family protein [Burkholderia ubonensis]
MMKTMTTVLFTASVLAGCSSASRPTFDAYSVTSPNQQQAYQVRCDGLFEGPGTCDSTAREICGSAPVRPLEAVAPYANGVGTRLLTFQCGAPTPVAQSVPQPAPAPVVAPVQAPPKKITLGGDANFDVDKAVLTADARSRLDQLIGQARGMTFRNVAVDGYTDSTGSEVHNVNLSERRAQTVANYLREHGLSAQQYFVNGHGKGNPVAMNTTDFGRAQNRRVEILLDAAN